MEELLKLKSGYTEYHPCIHRFFRKYPELITPNPTKLKLLPLRERTKELARPLIRRLLALWIYHSHVLSPEKRAKLLEMLGLHGFSLTDVENARKKTMKKIKEADGDEEEELKNLRRKKNDIDDDFEDEEEDEVDENNNKTTKMKKKEGGTKGIGNGSKKGARKKNGKGSKKGGGTKGIGKGSKKGKPVLPGWPHDVGTALFLKLFMTLGEQPDEGYISRASEYYDMQAHILLETVCRVVDIPIPLDFNKPSYVESKIIMASLNAAVWIAKNVVAPAVEIKDEQVVELLKINEGSVLKGKQKKNKAKKGKQKNYKNKTKKGKGKKKGKTKKKTSSHEESVPEQTEEVPVRKWDQLIFPLDVKQINSVEHNLESESETSNDFVNLTKYYDPNCPEFMYDGPRDFPKEIELEDGDWWHFTNNSENRHRQVPGQTLPYFHSLRPLILLHSENGTLSSEDLLPWYIMSDRSFYEFPYVRRNDMTTIEILEMVRDILVETVTVPQLTIAALLESLSLLCEAITLAEMDESQNYYEKLLDDKRTIVIEQMFLNFFGSAFRDYNENTFFYMRTICHRTAVLVRYLLEKTAKRLWQNQTSGDYDDREETCDIFSVVNESEIKAWNEWIEKLFDLLNKAIKMEAWFSKKTKEVLDMANDPINHNFSAWYSFIKDEAMAWEIVEVEEKDGSNYYNERANYLEPVRGRSVEEKANFVTLVEGEELSSSSVETTSTNSRKGSMQE